jgi:hypothetical protein
MVGLGPSTSNTSVRAIEEQQTGHPLRPTPLKGLGSIGSDIVTDNADMFQTKTVQKVSKILGQNIWVSGRDVFWITEPGLAEFAQTGRDDIEPLCERRDVFVPDT